MSCKLYNARVLEASIGQPQIAVFDQQDCQGNQRLLDIKNYYNFPAEAGVVQSMWLPPNVHGTIHTYYGYPEYNKKIIGENTNIYPDTSSLQPMYSASFDYKPNQSWDEMKLNCCLANTDAGASPQTCGGYWRERSENETGQCDSIIKAYCQRNPDKPVCACLPKSIPLTGIEELDYHRSLPLCQPQCVAEGYKFSTLRGQRCPDFKLCKQDMNMVGKDEAIIKDIVQIMDCDGTTTTKTPNGTTNSNSGGNINADFKSDIYNASSNNALLYFIVIFAVLIAIISMITTLSMKRSTMMYQTLPMSYNPYRQNYY
jgi:hypothetical protein